MLKFLPGKTQKKSKKAKQQGLSVETYTLQVLQEYILPKEKQSKLVNVLQSWMNESNSDEHQETGEYLIHALDEDRLSERKLFPVELKGVTW
ncbi:hypothetical protein WKK05_10665 [Nostoc sp. UHCC 0302]|uniref:hypothetical protein n=1 Tax=Nostoc sp. UHCC 0302 TaxID=3134896 RepID=UPI00311CA5A6